MDNVDIAQQQQDFLLAQQLAKVQVQPLSHHNQNKEGDFECIDCGEVVEPQRVRLGLTLRCIDCQQEFEKQRG